MQKKRLLLRKLKNKKLGSCVTIGRKEFSKAN